jgi:hypothetical protein
MQKQDNSARKSAKVWRYVLSVSLILSSLAAADEIQDLDKEVSQIDRVAKRQRVNNGDLQAVSKATGVPVAELEKQKAKTKMGPGSLFIANSLAKKSGKSFDDIVAAKRSGTGWGKFAREHDLKLGPLLRDAKKLSRVQRDNTSIKNKSSKGAEASQNSRSKNKGGKSNTSSNTGKSGKGGGKGKK